MYVRIYDVVIDDVWMDTLWGYEQTRILYTNLKLFPPLKHEGESGLGLFPRGKLYQL